MRADKAKKFADKRTNRSSGKKDIYNIAPSSPVNDWLQNIHSTLSTSENNGPNVKPLRMFNKNIEGGYTYANNEGGGTSGKYYLDGDNKQIFVDPTDMTDRGDIPKGTTWPNQRMTLQSLAHELGHQRSEYQLPTNDKTLKYLKQFGRMRPPDSGAMDKVQENFVYRDKYNLPHRLGNLPEAYVWDGNLPDHQGPLESYATDYADALLGGQSRIDKVPSGGRTYLPVGPMSHFRNGIKSKPVKTLISEGILPKSLDQTPSSINYWAMHNALLGPEYSKGKRISQREVNAKRYP